MRGQEMCPRGPRRAAGTVGRVRIRRLLLLGSTLLVGLLAITALLSPVPSVRQDGGVPAATDAGATDPDESPRARDRSATGDEPLVVSAQERGQSVSAPAGTQVTVQVRTREPVSVQVGEDGPIGFAEPEAPAEIPVYVDEGYAADILLVERDEIIGRLTAGPRADGAPAGEGP